MYYEKAADTDGYLKFSRRTPSGKRSRIVMPHFHNSAEMYVCVKGKYCVYINGENQGTLSMVLISDDGDYEVYVVDKAGNKSNVLNFYIE